MKSRYPDFFIIGAMKCATSSLHDQLQSLPDVFMSEPKEPNFFSDDAAFSRGMDWYCSLFEAAKKGDLVGESSTHYAKLPTYPQAVARMATAVRSPKIIYVMRHPIDRLISQYIHEWSQGNLNEDIDSAINSHPELVNYSRYHYQLQPYLDRFGHEKVLPLFFDRLKADPDRELQRLCDFIGYRKPVFWRNDLSPSNVSSQRIRKFPLYNLLIESPPMRILRRMLIPRWVRNGVKCRLTMRERPQLSLESRSRLSEIFDRDLAQLGDLFGVPLTCENFSQVTAAGPLYWRATTRTQGECHEYP